MIKEIEVIFSEIPGWQPSACHADPHTPNHICAATEPIMEILEDFFSCMSRLERTSYVMPKACHTYKVMTKSVVARGSRGWGGKGGGDESTYVNITVLLFLHYCIDVNSIAFDLHFLPNYKYHLIAIIANFKYVI